MDIYRRYRCDFGHEWIVRKTETEPETPSETMCIEGHEAVTCEIEVPVDEVQVVIRPAGRIVDEATGQRILDHLYWLVLLDRQGVEVKISSETYSWDEAAKKGRVFRGKSNSKACDLWDKLKL